MTYLLYLERAMGIEPTTLCLGSRAVEGGRADEVDRSALEPTNGGYEASSYGLFSLAATENAAEACHPI